MLLLARCGKDNGFTLIELMVALFIMMIGALALLQSVNLAIESNSSNKKRNDALLIADQAMGQERVKAFYLLTSAKLPNKRTLAGLGYVNYSVVEKVNKLAQSKTKNVQLTVSWRERGVRKSHSLTTVMSNYTSN
jgi:type IV pilus assembly protein PilV